MITNEIIYKNINDLLINRGWNIHENRQRSVSFVPPAGLQFSETYKLYVPNRYNNVGYDKDIEKTLNIISQIYDEDIDELFSIVVEDRQILSVHVDDDNLNNGKPTIPFFNTLIGKIKDLLQETANFSVIQKPHFFNKEIEAERYLNYCNFFKNEAGSLITKIQLPNREEIKERTLFEDSITGSQVNSTLIDVADFVNKDILDKYNFQPSDDFLRDNQSLLSVNVSNKLKDLYSCVDYADLDISLKGTTAVRTTIASDLNKEKITGLSDFSKTVRKKMKEIIVSEVFGKIVQLKSKDVDSDKNVITLEGNVKNVRSKILINLNSSQIKLAADAFKGNKTVKINGRLEANKSQYNVTNLESFKVI